MDFAVTIDLKINLQLICNHCKVLIFKMKKKFSKDIARNWVPLNVINKGVIPYRFIQHSRNTIVSFMKVRKEFIKTCKIGVAMSREENELSAI